MRGGQRSGGAWRPGTGPSLPPPPLRRRRRPHQPRPPGGGGPALGCCRRRDAPGAAEWLDRSSPGPSPCLLPPPPPPPGAPARRLLPADPAQRLLLRAGEEAPAAAAFCPASPLAQGWLQRQPPPRPCCPGAPLQSSRRGASLGRLHVPLRRGPPRPPPTRGALSVPAVAPLGAPLPEGQRRGVLPPPGPGVTPLQAPGGAFAPVSRGAQERAGEGVRNSAPTLPASPSPSCSGSRSASSSAAAASSSSPPKGSWGWKMLRRTASASAVPMLSGAPTRQGAAPRDQGGRGPPPGQPMVVGGGERPVLGGAGGEGGRRAGPGLSSLPVTLCHPDLLDTMEF